MLQGVVKMKINDVWVNNATVDDTKGLRFSAELINDNYPRNTELDMSCAYGLSKGKYSPVCNVTSYVATYNMDNSESITQENLDVICDNKTTPFNYLLLSDNSITHTIADEHNGVSIVTNWGYDVNADEEAFYVDGRGTHLITGFTYNNTCMYISRVTCCDSTFNNFKDCESLTEYVNSYSNEYPYIITITTGIITGGVGNVRQSISATAGFASKYTHQFNKYTITAGILEKTEKHATSLDYATTNKNVVLGCAFGSSRYDIPFTNATNSSGSATLLVNPQWLETTILDNTTAHLALGLNPKIYKYYDFEKNGVEPIHKMMSSMGLVWAYDVTTAQTAHLFSGVDECYYPVLKNGFYQGDYVNADKAKDLPQANWGDNYDEWYGDNGVDDNPDNNHYVDDIELNKPTLSTINTFNRSFIINKIGVDNLSNFLWHSDDSKFEMIVEGLKLLGQNPMNGIIDLRMYPFDVSALAENLTSEQITVGRTNTEVNALAIRGGCNCVIELGSAMVRGYHNNFLDFEPYTTAMLYIPYVGTVNIDIATFINKTLNVKLIVDLTTGQGTAVVFCNNIPYMYLNANVGVNIALSGDNASVYAQGVISAGASTLTSTVTTALGVASGNVGVAVGGAVGGLGSAYSAFAQPVNMQRSGNNTPNCNTCAPQHCYLFIASPIVNKPDNYGHTIGYACEKSVTVGSVSGFSVFSNIDGTGLLCTDTERKEIISLLNEGVYL